MCPTYSTSTASDRRPRMDCYGYGAPTPTRRHDDYRLLVFAVALAFVVAAVFAVWREVAPFV